MRKKTGATWLFLLIRYMALISVCILNTATYIPMSDKVRNMPVTPLLLIVDVSRCLEVQTVSKIACVIVLIE